MYNFGLSECSRVKPHVIILHRHDVNMSNFITKRNKINEIKKHKNKIFQQHLNFNFNFTKFQLKVSSVILHLLKVPGAPVFLPDRNDKALNSIFTQNLRVSLLKIREAPWSSG